MTARVYRFVTAASDNLQRLSGSPCKLVGASLINTVDAPYYVKLWWSSAAPVVGTTPPDLVIAVPALDPAAGADGSVCVSWPNGVAQAMADLWVACVTGAADNATTAVAAGQGVVSLLLE